MRDSKILDFKITLKNGKVVPLLERMTSLGYDVKLYFDAKGILDGSFLPPGIMAVKNPTSYKSTKIEDDEVWALFHVHKNAFCEVVKMDLMRHLKPLLTDSSDRVENKNDKGA